MKQEHEVIIKRAVTDCDWSGVMIEGQHWRLPRTYFTLVLPFLVLIGLDTFRLCQTCGSNERERGRAFCSVFTVFVCLTPSLGVCFYVCQFHLCVCVCVMTDHSGEHTVYVSSRLCSCKLTVKSCRSLATVLRSGSRLTQLNLSFSDLSDPGDSGVECLSAALKSLPCKPETSE